MKRMTSEIITVLQKMVVKHGDLPFEVLDADNGVNYFVVAVFARTAENLSEDETPSIGLMFM